MLYPSFFPNQNDPSSLLYRVLEEKSTAESSDIEKPQEEKNEKTLEKEQKKEETIPEPPPISIALQDELDEFKNYLKSRMGAINKEESVLHPYDPPKVNRFDNDFDEFYSSNMNRKDFEFDKFNDPFFDADFMGEFDDLGFSEDDFPVSRRKKKDKDVNIQDLPDKLKILLFTDFFNNRFL